MSDAAKLSKALRDLRALFAYRLPRDSGLLYVVASTAISGLLPLATVYLTRPLIDGLTLATRTRNFTPVLWTAALLAASLLAGELLRVLSTWTRTHLTERVQDHIMELVHRKSVEVDLSFYDSAEFYDHLHRARSEATYRPAMLVESLAGLLQNSITLLAMLALLTSFGLWVPAALAAATLPAFAIVLWYAVRRHQLHLRTTADERRTWYYDWLLTARETASEIRLFGSGPRFIEAYKALRTRIRNRRLGLARANAFAELAASAVALAVSGACLGWMFWQTLNGAVTLGTLALFYGAFAHGQRLTHSLLDNVGQVYYNSLFLGNLFEFLQLEPKLAAPPRPLPPPERLRTSLEFRDVTFTYPGASEPVLRRFNLAIPAGRIVAFVGPNGAGKSTFIKLLCRFYDPDAGAILWDGADLRAFSPGDLRSRITVLFQEPVRYNASARDNIGPDPVPAASAAGASDIIDALPQAYDTTLGKLFTDGVELSGGQWQRVALARAFARNAPLLILDEPTSSMDPWAEADWFERFRAHAADRTAILITHRFTTAMRADLIHVIADGAIVESGSHLDLIDSGGLYAQSWHEQTTCSR